MKIYSVRQTAELLQCTERTVYNYITSGELKAKKLGKSWRITDENINEFLNTDTNIDKLNNK